MSKALVTGGAGFIGCHVARELLRMKHDVVVLDDLSGGFRDNVPERCTFIQGNVLDHGLVNSLFEERRFDYVFHLAAYAAEGLSHFIKRFNHANNVIGSVNVVNACVNHGVQCLVFTSSIAVYGAAQLPMLESTIPAPEDSYGISKFAVELELAESRRMFGLDYVIFRPHNVYGEYQNIGDTYRNVIGIFMNQIMQGKPMTIFGDGEQTRAFSYIGDVAPIIARSVEVRAAYNEIFNVGGDQAYSVKYLARTVAQAMGVNPDTVHLPARHEVVHAYSSHEKVRGVFGTPACCPLEEGVARMARWAKQVGPRQGSIFADVEIRKNLPASWAKLLGQSSSAR